VRTLRGYQFPEDTGPMTHPVRPDSYIKMDNFYTMTVYNKGAELVRMIHQLLGEVNFRKAIDLYFEKFDGMAVTIEDFVSVMEDASSIDLSQFKLWYFQSGTPTVAIKRFYNSDTRQLKLTFQQTTTPDRNQSDKQHLHIPVNFGIIDENGNDITPENQALLELKSETETFVFDNIPPNCLPSFFRQFSAPVKIITDLSNEDLAFLMAHDSDEFNRWDSAQTLFFHELTAMIQNIEDQNESKVSSNLINAFKNALTDQKADNALLAKTLSLPLETEIKNQFDRINVSAIHKARLKLQQEIAGQLKDQFLEVIETCSKSDPLSISHEAMADRSLKNVCLSYLGSLKQPGTTQLILDHYASAQNMTDEIACFNILSHINSETKEQAVQQFYTKWNQDKLVLDKWFAVQAGSTLPDTLGVVTNLMQHPDFSIQNPNKVRSLIHMFAMMNDINFHRKDGAGYQFVADQVIALDQVNPQVTARLASCFNHWKKYDEPRQVLMQKELERILAVQALSKNVYEIVSRALE